ncbi:SAF domain-containing protein [Streptomyces sp. 3211]|uniref:SAF domain-containing protein n=1 Tax=Streptomyces sp. 3211 TaxID=1964449 RepID=UPI0009A4FF1B|nr:SAF domain-containing protein [Streptomyces sp. 3211]
MESPAAPPLPRPTGPRTELPITTAAPVKKQRQYAAAALSTVLAVTAALGAAAAVSAVGDRTKVLAIANDVPAGQPLTDADIIVAEVSADAALTPMPATDRATVVGKRPAVDLRKGSLLVAGQLQPGIGLGDDRQQVGVQVKRGQAPSGSLVPGDKVLAVTVPAQGEQPTGKDGAEAPPTSVKAVVVSVSRTDASGAVVVNLAVASSDGPLLATRASSGRIALVRDVRSGS